MDVSISKERANHAQTLATIRKIANEKSAFGNRAKRTNVIFACPVMT